MPSTQSLIVNNITQSVQSGDYWLISVDLSEKPDTMGLFYMVDGQPEQTLSLFNYQFPSLQLLSQRPLSETLLKSETLLLTQLPHNEVNLKPEHPILLLASDLGVGPLFYYAKQIKTYSHNNLALLHASTSFPFAVKPAQFMLEDFPHEAIGACSLLEDWKIANRLASDIGLPGCFEGSLVDLLDYWLSGESQTHLKDETRVQWQVLSFLPERCNQQLETHLKSYPWLSLQTADTPTSFFKDYSSPQS